MHNRQAVDAVNTPTRHLPSEQEVNAFVTEAFEHRHVLPAPSICLNVSHQPDSHRRSTCLIPTGSSRGHAIAIGLTSARASRSPTRVSSGLSGVAQRHVRVRLRQSNGRHERCGAGRHP
jgi:hypothetical protein